ncbi:hypothetical protein EMCRGX_G014876 [Ephydatia muelleri]
MVALLRNCPQEVTHLRKELLIAVRHILATDLRNKFLPCIDHLFDENLLIGSGWTTRESVLCEGVRCYVRLWCYVRVLGVM